MSITCGLLLRGLIPGGKEVKKATVFQASPTPTTAIPCRQVRYFQNASMGLMGEESGSVRNEMIHSGSSQAHVSNLTW
jgi:hypothetical protein